MAIPIKFNKSRAQELLLNLASGTPIEPSNCSGWSGNDMLTLAGVCFFGAMSHGPASFWGREIPDNLQPEYKEANEEAFFNDLHAAIEFYGHLAQLVQDKMYDEHNDPEVVALVSQDGEVRKTVRPIKGMRIQE